MTHKLLDVFLARTILDENSTLIFTSRPDIYNLNNIINLVTQTLEDCKCTSYTLERMDNCVTVTTKAPHYVMLTSDITTTNQFNTSGFILMYIDYRDYDRYRQYIDSQHLETQNKAFAIKIVDQSGQVFWESEWLATRPTEDVANTKTREIVSQFLEKTTDKENVLFYTTEVGHKWRDVIVQQLRLMYRACTFIKNNHSLVEYCIGDGIQRRIHIAVGDVNKVRGLSPDYVALFVNHRFMRTSDFETLWAFSSRVWAHDVNSVGLWLADEHQGYFSSWKEIKQVADGVSIVDEVAKIVYDIRLWGMR